MKIKSSAAYWTIGLGVFAVLVLLLCPPIIWEKIGVAGYTSGRSFMDNTRSWVRRGNENVVIAVKGAMHRPKWTPSRQNKKPRCLRWHTAKRGQTQWFLAKAYAPNDDTHQWLKGMRWISQKHEGDSKLRVGESVCVRWVRKN